MYIADIYLNSNPDCSCSSCSTDLFLHEEVNNITKGLMDHVHMDSELCGENIYVDCMTESDCVRFIY